MRTRAEIVEAIRRSAKDNGGTPLGVVRFENETGIKPYDWGKFWARFGDALKEAGFAPNQFQGAYSKDFVLEKLVALVRKLGKFPTFREIDVECTHDTQFPTKKVFQRLGGKGELAKRLLEYCNSKSGYNDVLQLCNSLPEKQSEKQNSEDTTADEMVGEVYLFKSGRYYKIGKTYDIVRRGSELRIQLPERMDLIHTIKTDDPTGVELYWHKRFESKRKNGEWFDLTSSDIKAFKRWRRIY